jgi:hypothetical protein
MGEGKFATFASTIGGSARVGCTAAIDNGAAARTGWGHGKEDRSRGRFVPDQRQPARTARPARARRARFGLGDAVRASDDAPRDYAGRRGLVTELGPGTSEYRVEFEDGRRPTTGYLLARCLEPA